MLSFIENFWQLFVLSAPWLLVGLLVAAIMKTWIPMDWLQKQLGGDGVKPVIKGLYLVPLYPYVAVALFRQRCNYAAAAPAKAQRWLF